MNASVHHLPIAVSPDRPVHVTPSRFVTVDLFCTLTGYTEPAVRMKIHKGIWLEGRQWIKREGRVHMDMEAYERWVETGTA